LAVWRSKVCKSLELAVEEAAGLAAVLPMVALFFGAFSGAERLTLNVLFCWANPLRLMPTSTTGTDHQYLIFNPLLPNL
jgi:hypothetical protein